MFLLHKSFFISLWIKLTLGTIPGLSYMDPIRQRPLAAKLSGEDPCNPLYWYPRTIPDYCYFKPPVNTPINNTPLPVPLPVPVPSLPLIQVHHMPVLPMPLPIMPPPLPIDPPIMPPPPPIVAPIMPPPQIPIALPPIYPQSLMMPTVPADHSLAYGSNIRSHFSFPYSIHGPQAGLVPGLPGLVTKDGGINIMPFSDVYADMLEKHKNKMIRKKLQRIINEYEQFPNSRKYLKLKKLNRLMNFH